MKKYKGYLIDLDGTMYKGEEPIEAAASFIKVLVAKGIPYVFLTNNASRTPEELADKLNSFGIPATKDHVFTTSLATANYIKKQKSDANCFVIGEKGLVEAIEAADLTIVKNDCDFVVIGLDRQITYEKLAKACLEIRKGALFISTNSDVAIPTEHGFYPGNGAITAVLTASTGIAPIFIGKPESIIMNEAIALLDVDPSDILMVGDNYDTDIQAGIRAGLDTLMVLTGVAKLEDIPNYSVKPTNYVASLADWIDRI